MIAQYDTTKTTTEAATALPKPRRDLRPGGPAVRLTQWLWLAALTLLLVSLPAAAAFFYDLFRWPGADGTFVQRWVTEGYPRSLAVLAVLVEASFAYVLLARRAIRWPYLLLPAFVGLAWIGQLAVVLATPGHPALTPVLALKTAAAAPAIALLFAIPPWIAEGRDRDEAERA
ncbi:membrane protein of unknown function [Methylacidimicrobium sp. AP8]|uniref:hypothetical protein n=1 Tax=Methylacidimicrobium sp. AP8 TaxID=2730359 RepID=UPI0018C1204A|nr:hypothetical protein [Methylacidimicrobium sp. AP8]CAB4242818.1 membrane protein of unknown function [Methylacidimicrobium sp. AP8]